jgi:phosphoribosyl 1,2-cyclic phosphodiesterase
LGLQPEDINAIVVTHEHSDHIRGVFPLAKKYKIPVMMTSGTSKFLKGDPQAGLTLIDTHSDFFIGKLQITPVPVAHDAREPVQFVVRAEGLTLGILTDLGTVTRHVIECYKQCDGLIVESNHDIRMLANGPYSSALKKRVGGAWGHLNNAQMLYFLKNIQLSQLQQLVIGHISQKNNSVSLVRAAISEVGNQLASISYATQDEGFLWVKLKI